MTKAQLVAELEGLLGSRPVEAKVLLVVAEVRGVSAAVDARAEMALALAREIDSPPEKRSTAQVSKELRVLLDQLEAVAGVDDDDDDELSGLLASMGDAS